MTGERHRHAAEPGGRRDVEDLTADAEGLGSSLTELVRSDVVRRPPRTCLAVPIAGRTRNSRPAVDRSRRGASQMKIPAEGIDEQRCRGTAQIVLQLPGRPV